MAQAGSNYEKNEGPKSRWTVPLIKNLKNLKQLQMVVFYPFFKLCQACCCQSLVHCATLGPLVQPPPPQQRRQQPPSR